MQHPRRHPAALCLLIAWGAAGASSCACQPAPRTAIPVLHAARAAVAPRIDGLLGDEAWRAATPTDPFVDTLTGAAATPASRARMTWDDDALYVAFEVDDTFLRSTFTRNDDRLWEQDVVELMIDPDGDGAHYVELQVSPTNHVFDSWFDARRVPAPFGHIAWSSGLRSAVSLEGTVNDDDDDAGWHAEMAIPWTAFATVGPGTARPSPGASWRIALYVLDARAEGQTGVGWSAPLVGDFHVPARFGTVVFD